MLVPLDIMMKDKSYVLNVHQLVLNVLELTDVPSVTTLMSELELLVDAHTDMKMLLMEFHVTSPQPQKTKPSSQLPQLMMFHQLISKLTQPV